VIPITKPYEPTRRQEDWATSIVDDLKERARKGHDDLGIDPTRTRINEKWFYSLVIDKAIQDYKKDRIGFLRGLKDYLAATKKAEDKR
jgi:hypothetical protein